MRFLLAALGVMAVLAALSAGPGAAAAPTLRSVSLAPLRLRGTGFQPRERVRVTLAIRPQAWRSTRTADASGAFTYRPAWFVAVDPCRGTIVVTALGLSSGRRATWKRACRPPDVWPSFVAGRAA